MPDDVVAAVQSDIANRDWPSLRLKLHPYLRWRDADGTVWRGRRNVLAMLEGAPAPGRPAAHELRDGQIYRWTA